MNILQMSVTAGILVIAIVLIRSVALNRLPKIMFLVLWGLVLLRLFVPFSIPLPNGVYTYINEMNPAVISETPQITINLSENIETAPTAQSVFSPAEFSVTNTSDMRDRVIIIWLSGMTLMFCWFTVIYLKNHRKLRFSIPINENDSLNEWLEQHRLWRKITIMRSDMITTPIAVGLIKPKIILPKNMDMNDEQLLEHILLHEYFHIKRFDALWKIIMVLGLCIHWFNPLVWITFVLINRDLELTCDEMVLRHFGAEKREDYAYSIIGMAEWRNAYASLYNGFSKNAAEERIESIMKFTKKSPVKTVLSFLMVAILALGGFITVFPQTTNVMAAESGISGTLPQVSSQRARNIAEAHTGYPARDAVLFIENGRLTYEVDIRNDVLRYMVYIDAITGEIIRVEDYQIAPTADVSQPVQSQTLPQISSQAARDIAEEHTGYPAREALLFSDNGHLTYEVDIRNDVLRYMVYVSAITGDIIRVEDYDITPAVPQTVQTIVPQTQQEIQPQVPITQAPIYQNGTITAESARQIALNHVGRGTVIRHETKNNHIKVCIQDGNEHFDIRVDFNGNVTRTQMRPIVSIGNAANNSYQTATISHEQAAQIAINRAGGGVVIKNELCFHSRNGGLIYHVDVVIGQTEYKMDINAATGDIIKYETKTSW